MLKCLFSFIFKFRIVQRLYKQYTELIQMCKHALEEVPVYMRPYHTVDFLQRRLIRFARVCTHIIDVDIIEIGRDKTHALPAVF